jgi:hypothetical protein
MHLMYSGFLEVKTPLFVVDINKVRFYLYKTGSLILVWPPFKSHRKPSWGETQ